jgi:two-component system LytT family sensor kinase
MKKSFKTLLHIGFWLGYLILIMIIMFAAFQGRDIPPDDYGYYFWFIFGIGIVPPVLSFYSYYYYLFPKYLQKRKVLLSVVFGLLISVVTTLAGFLVITLTNEEAFICIRDGFPYASTFTLTLSTLFGVMALVLKGFLTWYEELKLKEELLEKNFRMELALVKSQLDPHFLFNTINNIDVLISKDPEEASQYLNQLSDIMRFMLYETKAEEIPLSKELEYIEKYIQLQKIRTANNNFVHYHVVGTTKEKKVAPMVFIPFIENAFKHSANKKIDNAVDIAIRIEDHSVVFKCQNKFEPDKSSANGHNGLGNELIKKRLDLLYPEKHTLTVDRQDDKYSVELTILNGKV